MRIMAGLRRRTLRRAIRDNNIQKAQKIVVRHPSLINSPLTSGQVPLTEVIGYGYCEMVKMLLNRGADPNLGCRGDTKSQPALHLAAYWGNHTIAATLLEKGADVNLIYMGHTPLDCALRDIISSSLVQLLLEKGAKFSEMEKDIALLTQKAMQAIHTSDGTLDEIVETVNLIARAVADLQWLRLAETLNTFQTKR